MQSQYGVSSFKIKGEKSAELIPKLYGTDSKTLNIKEYLSQKSTVKKSNIEAPKS